MQIGDVVMITGWPFVAGRGGYGDCGTVEAISAKSVAIKLVDGGPRTVEHIQDVRLVKATK